MSHHFFSLCFYSSTITLFFCIQDYPSISQLSHKIAEKKVNVIFAITREQVPVYERLSKFIEGSKVGELADDSGNVVELVEENYNVSNCVE